MATSGDYIVRVSRIQNELYSVTAIWGTTQHNTSTSEADLIKADGQGLFTLCAPELYAQARQQSAILRIVIMIAPEAAHLHTIAWETLHDGATALGLHHAIVRYTPSPAPRTSTIDTPPLRILLTVNSNDATSEQTERLLTEVMRRTQGIVTSVVLRNPTQMRIYSELNDAERRHEPYHIWHHIGALANPLGVMFADGPLLAPHLHKMLSTLPELRAVLFQSAVTHAQRTDWLKTCSQLDAARVFIFDTDSIALSTYQIVEAFYHNLLTDNISVGILRARQRVSQISFDDRDWTRGIMMLRTLEDAWFTPQPQQDNILPKQTPGTKRDQVFVSYSHKDTDWLKRLEVMLKPLTRSGTLDVWTDKRIDAGDDWRHEIETALKRAKVAVMLVSPDFLASDFVQDVEIPSLLDAAKQEGVAILWVPVSDCLYRYTPIARYQAMIDPSSPLDSLVSSDANSALRKIAETIARKMQNT